MFANCDPDPHQLLRNISGPQCELQPPHFKITHFPLHVEVLLEVLFKSDFLLKIKLKDTGLVIQMMKK